LLATQIRLKQSIRNTTSYTKDLKQQQATKPAGPEVAMSRSTTWRSPIFGWFPEAHRQPKCGANPKSDLERTRIAAVKGELWSGARLEQGLGGVEGVHGDGGSAYRRCAGGRVADEHAVAQRLAASNHCGGPEWVRISAFPEAHSDPYTVQSI
jgi:hypothetical protein